ncbi:MAG: MotA/TolQ/ExbB proton channel family protein [Planctomycetes bacterium]|nr:MotA/TolQ/ExbB proton channel family protein [Planctomycetota bacterium]
MSRFALSAVLALTLAAPAVAQERRSSSPAGGDQGREALTHAYQKEYAFLASEQAALERRLAEVEADAARRAAAAAADLGAVEERLRALRLEVEAERARLVKLDEEAAALDDGAGALEGVLSQAAALLPPGDRPPDHPGDRVHAVDQALGELGALLRRRASVRRAPGSFFLADGSEATGDLVWVGAVACLGAGPRGAGALAPAGGGGLQLWEATGGADAASAARAAAGGALPATLPVYVFESLDKPADRPVVKTPVETVRRGGEVAWVIVGLGLVAVCLAAGRVAILWRAGGDPAPLLDAVAPLVAAGRAGEALAKAQAGRGAAARVVAAMLPHLGQGADRLESAASERMLQEGLRIERFEAALLVAAAVAPLLGLLGTVTGMISTFDVITVHGTGDPKLLAGGISEALITTQLGLSVAIPALLAGNLLTSWGEALRAGMERAALRVTLLTLPPPPPPPRPVRTTSSRLPVPDEPELVGVGAGEPAA